METRICSKCGIEKDIEEFPLRNQRTNKRQSYCTSCRSDLGKSWYERNKTYQKANAKRHSTVYSRTAKEYVWSYLLSHPCIQCGESDPVVLEFHHVGGKDRAISELIGRGATLGKIKEELLRCQVLCANCHRRVTAQERGWFRSKK